MVRRSGRNNNRDKYSRWVYKGRSGELLIPQKVEENDFVECDTMQFDDKMNALGTFFLFSRFHKGYVEGNLQSHPIIHHVIFGVRETVEINIIIHHLSDIVVTVVTATVRTTNQTVFTYPGVIMPPVP